VTFDGRALDSAADKPPPSGTIVVRPAPPATSDVVGERGVAFGVVFEDEHLIVVEKPAGLVVHPAKGHETGTLVHGLLGRPGWPTIAPHPDDPGSAVRPGVVHRIDRGTSGLLVVAKNAETREGLKDLFAKHDLDREYLAIAAGVARAGTIDTPYGRNPGDRVKFTSRSGERRAVTRVSVVEALAGATLVRCRLETGRTHQIRVHLTEQLGTPIVGDTLYGKPPASGLVAEVWKSMGHQALHAHVLGFVHPVTKKSMRWQSEPPPDFQDALRRLRA
jgi:23S rRNA pseudouridine1911/1915/1917 synthase